MSKLIKKLKHLRRMIKNIPAENINLGSFVVRWDKEDWKKCILCPGGWVATDPFLTIKDYQIDAATGYFLDRYGKRTYDNFAALETIFDGLTSLELQTLFASDDSYKPQSEHKAIFLADLDVIINEYEYA
jgi:hypothetical protein